MSLGYLAAIGAADATPPDAPAPLSPVADVAVMVGSLVASWWLLGHVTHSTGWRVVGTLVLGTGIQFTLNPGKAAQLTAALNASGQ